MGQTITLQASDDHELSAYEASPHTEHHRGGLVIIQEIFGVNQHIRDVADGWAEEGYYCIAPSIFDRESPGFDVGYDEADMQAGRELAQKIGLDAMLLDVDAARAAAASAGKVGVIGYCLGGSLAWLAATRLDAVAAASCYYGGRIVDSATEVPRCPVQMHFGEKDGHIPMESVEKIRAVISAKVEIYTYPAGHAFNREGGPSYDPQSAQRARERTLALLRANVG
jgi:carboxymethylenebutenolidase